MAVTKNHSVDIILKAFKHGIKLCGENKVQEAMIKHPHLPSDIELHFIGHLQSNKIKKAINIFNVIQTVDSLRLAEKINNQAKEINKTQRIYCQINIGNDPNKTGITPAESETTIRNILRLDYLNLEGIMTILPQHISHNESKLLYIKTKQIRDKTNEAYHKNLELSMGMSNDYKLAIQCGATMVRIGTKLFGSR